MADVLYLSMLEDLVKGNIDFDTDSFKAMMTTSTYTPNSDTHTKRSDVTNEVSGTGYTAGGTAVTCTVSKDTVNDRVNLTFSNPSWTTATITNARRLIIYKSRGGAATADELVSCSDFGADISSTGGTFAVTFSIPLRLNNSNP